MLSSGFSEGLPRAGSLEDIGIMQTRQPPSDLVRLTRAEWGLEFLLNGQLPIGFADEFNDPFEFLMAEFDESSLVGLNYREILLDPRSYLHRDPKQVAKMNDEECRIYVLDCLRRFPSISRNRLAQLFGVVCFSSFEKKTIWRQPEMVNHFGNYADNHRGMAFFFDQNHDIFRCLQGLPNAGLVKVHYDDSNLRVSIPPRLALHNSDESFWEMFKKVSARKSSAWAHEEEWRLLLPAKGCTLGSSREEGNESNWSDFQVSIKSRLIHPRIRYFLALWDPAGSGKMLEAKSTRHVLKRIVLGCRASEDLKRNVRATLESEDFKDISLYEAILDERRTTFNYRVLNAKATKEAYFNEV